MKVSQFKVKEREDDLLEIITRLEKLGWYGIKVVADRNKYNEYFLTVTGHVTTLIPDEKIAGAENAIMCQITRFFDNPYVKIRATTPKQKSTKPATMTFEIIEDMMYATTK
jgi:hypothetical protein